MPIKPSPKPTAKSTGKINRRRRNNKLTLKNKTPLKTHHHKKTIKLNNHYWLLFLL